MFICFSIHYNEISRQLGELHNYLTFKEGAKNFRFCPFVFQMFLKMFVKHIHFFFKGAQAFWTILIKGDATIFGCVAN